MSKYFFIAFMTFGIVFNLIIAFLPLNWISSVNFLAAGICLKVVVDEFKFLQKEKPEDWTTVE